MKKKSLWKKMMSVVLAGTMVVGMAGSMTGCGRRATNKTITLDVFSQVANFSGMQSGWIADILKEKFNIRLNIIPNTGGVLQTRMQDGDLGDIVIWGTDSDNYAKAVKNGLMFDWNDEDLVKEEAPYIYEHMQDALKKNSELTKQITDGESDTCYGIGNNIATSNEDHQAFFYTWDLRWDIYKELGFPKVKTLEDFENLLVDMQKACPKDDSGNPTYAVSLWPDWDVDYCMYVKATATAWYGYDELGIGLYDPETGNYYDAMMEGGPYLEMLKFYNDLFQKGLVDPDSMTQTYDKMAEKVQNGGVLFSIFNYSGSLAFNKPKHLDKGQIMYCMAPEDARPIVYGMNTPGGDYKTCLGAKTKYPELCMNVLNYFATPEGHMTYKYGPKGICWDYDKDGNTQFTELGLQCKNDEKTTMGNGYKGTVHDGVCQAAFSSWADDAENPDSNGETYNSDNWKSNRRAAASGVEQEWRDYNKCDSINEYFENRTRADGSKNYLVSPGTSFQLGEKDNELKTTWSQVTTKIKNGSWKAIYAKSDKEFDKIVKDMISDTKKYGYDKCLAWAKEQAAERHKLEQATSQKSADTQEETDSEEEAE
ncbi:MAG: hypothetical protein IJ733_07780 [Lachnospiraceae bacterium]|nr:hypothetical protein [Lachnospiraceae bacterium]